MVQGIIIPADNSASLTVATFETLEDYQQVVGGWIEAVDIPDLGVTIYVNEEELIRDLPFNRRATFLWRFHVPQAREQSALTRAVVTHDHRPSSWSATDHRRSLGSECEQR